MASLSSGQELVAGSCQHDNACLAFKQLAADRLPTLTKLLFGFRLTATTIEPLRKLLRLSTYLQIVCAILLASHIQYIFVIIDAYEVECGRMNSMGRTG